MTGKAGQAELLDYGAGHGKGSTNVRLTPTDLSFPRSTLSIDDDALAAPGDVHGLQHLVHVLSQGTGESGNKEGKNIEKRIGEKVRKNIEEDGSMGQGRKTRR